MSLPNRRPKGKIKPPKRSNLELFENILATTHDNFTDNWDRLSQAIREIHRMNAAQLSFEELYRTAYNMVLHKQGERLHTGVRQVLTQYLEEVANEQIVPAFGISDPGSGASGSFSSGISTGGAGGAAQGTEFLKVLIKAWTQHTTCLQMIRDILMYMDLYYAKPANVPLVYDLGLDLFRDHVIRSRRYPIRSRLLSVLLQQIQLEREGEIIDRSAIKSAIDMLLQLSDSGVKCVYQTDFEGMFLETSAEFYRLEGQLLVDQCDASEYMRKVEKRLMEEDSRTQQYLHSSTKSKILALVETELITKHLKTIIEMENSGIVPMLMNDKYVDLSRMYKLFSKVSCGLQEMRTAISEHIRVLGRQINENVDTSPASTGVTSPQNGTEDQPTASDAADTGKTKSAQGKNAAGVTVGATMAIRWVQDVLDLKDKFDNVLETAVGKDKSFQTAFNGAFEKFINELSKSPEFISLFIDENLKKGLKGKTEEEVEQVLDKTICLFRFIQEKDVFERYYKQHLAKRLLYARSISDEAEKQMISKLKIECGYQFTTKLEGMFNDMRTSADINDEFRRKTTSAAATNMDISVTVLTSTYWPMSSSPPGCTPPPEIAASCEAFNRFYMHRHNGRKLTWQMNMGNADVRAVFGARKHELNVSTYSMIILMLFNKSDTLTFKAIQEETDIPDADLRRNLQSLACAKYKILLKEPRGRDVFPTDTFSFNGGFTASLSRLKIQTVASKPETETERKDTKEKVDEARKHMVEAAIVRVMKDRKSLDHNNLVAEVTKQLQPRFQPTPAMIKKRIEALIEREYLERKAGDRKIYDYLA